MTPRPTAEIVRRDRKDAIVMQYQDRKLSRKLAGTLLADIGYEEWEQNLFLDDDQTGPE